MQGVQPGLDEQNMCQFRLEPERKNQRILLKKPRSLFQSVSEHEVKKCSLPFSALTDELIWSELHRVH